MRKFTTALALTLALAVAAPGYSAGRFDRDTDPIGRFVKFVKSVFTGMTTFDTVIGPIPH